MQLPKSVTDWLRNEECNHLNKIVREYCGDGKVSIEYKTFPDQIGNVGDQCLKRVFIYDVQGNNTATRVSVVDWTTALESAANPALTGISISHFQVEADRPSGTIVGELCGIGGIPGYTFLITADPSNKFDIINGDQLVLTDTADIDDGSYLVTIQVTDAESNVDTEIFEIAVVAQPATGTFTFTGLSTGGRITELALTDASWTAVPASALTDRNSIAVQNISGNGGTVLWNYSNAAPLTEGWRIEDGGFKSVAVRDGITIYAKMLSGSGTVAIDEVA